MTSAPQYDENGERYWTVTGATPDHDPMWEFVLDLQETTIANYEARTGLAELLNQHEQDE